MMTLADLEKQNKKAFDRIRELEIEMHEMETLIADNLVKIYEIKIRESGTIEPEE